MDEPKKLAIGKIRHKQSEDEREFYRTLGESLRSEREKASVTQSRIGKEIGFSAQQVRKFESGETPIPSYVMIKYADFLRISLEELVAGWADDQTRSVYKEILSQKEGQGIKRLTDAERALISWLRIDFNKIGSMKPAELLFYLKKKDLDLIYCMKLLETAEEDRVQEIAKALRKQIYELYMLHGNDEKGSAGITENLDDTPKNVPEQEVSLDFDEE